MKKIKVKIEYPVSFELDQHVLFTIINPKNYIKIYIGTLCKDDIGYYIHINNHLNRIIFEELSLNSQQFCVEKLKLPNLGGYWPFTKTLKEQYLILKSLEHLDEL